MKVKSSAMLCLKENLKRARKQAGLTQEELAEQIGVSRSAVSKWETGKKTPNLDNLAELSIVLSISADYLLGLKEYQTGEKSTILFSPKVETALEALIAAVREETRLEK